MKQFLTGQGGPSGVYLASSGRFGSLGWEWGRAGSGSMDCLVGYIKDV